MLGIEEAIPVIVEKQLIIRDFVKSEVSGDLFIGFKLGTAYCHLGELLRRKAGDPEVSNQGISDKEFEEKMFKLLEGGDPGIVAKFHEVIEME